MIIDPKNKKKLVFDVNIDGAETNEIESYLKVKLKDYNLMIPMVIEDQKTVGTIPALMEMRSQIPDDNKLEIELISIVEESIFTPFSTTLDVKEILQVEAKINEPARTKVDIESEVTIKSKEKKVIKPKSKFGAALLNSK